MAFELDRVKAVAPQHPEWKDKEPFASLLNGDVKGALAGGEKAILEIVMASHAGMTSDEFEQIVKTGEMKTAKPATYPPSVIKVSLFVVVVVMLSFAAQSAWAKTAEEIDAGVYACLDRFYHQIKGGREMVAMAEGVMVMPDVVKAGFIVGGEFGEGALRVGGKTVSYYNITSGSVGLQIGGQAKDFVILFMTNEALKRFQDSRGWEVGIDGNVALVNVGGGERVDFIRMNDPIIVFVFDVKGLIADISLKGAKFTKINP